MVAQIASYSLTTQTASYTSLSVATRSKIACSCSSSGNLSSTVCKGRAESFGLQVASSPCNYISGKGRYLQAGYERFDFLGSDGQEVHYCALLKGLDTRLLKRTANELMSVNFIEALSATVCIRSHDSLNHCFCCLQGLHGTEAFQILLALLHHWSRHIVGVETLPHAMDSVQQCQSLCVCQGPRRWLVKDCSTTK